MILKIFDSDEALNEWVAARIKIILKEKPDALLCLPSGNSPVGIYDRLMQMDSNGEVDFGNAYIVGLDEWDGFGHQEKVSCYYKMDQLLFSRIGINKGNICFFDGGAEDMEKECRKIDDFIFSHGCIDFILLGVGLNGHLGFNEPGSGFNEYSHAVILDEVTKKVAREKYNQDKEVPARGLTLGIKHIEDAAEAVVIILGKHKASITSRIISEEPDPSLPATVIKEHRNGYILLDKDAAAQINL